MGISIWQLLIILAIVLVLFGAKRLRNLGGDLGSAIKGFRSAMKEDDDSQGWRQAGRPGQRARDQWRGHVQEARQGLISAVRRLCSTSVSGSFWLSA